MKQVWQSVDGRIFNTVEECEAYEDKVQARNILEEYLIDESSKELAKDFISSLDFFVKQGLAFKLRTYINSIEP